MTSFNPYEPPTESASALFVTEHHELKQLFRKFRAEVLAVAGGYMILAVIVPLTAMLIDDTFAMTIPASLCGLSMFVMGIQVARVKLMAIRLTRWFGVAVILLCLASLTLLHVIAAFGFVIAALVTMQCHRILRDAAILELRGVVLNGSEQQTAFMREFASFEPTDYGRSE